MSDISDLIADIQIQLKRKGLDEILCEVKKAEIEIGDIQEYVANAFLQDFRYDNVEQLATTLRASRQEIDMLYRAAGFSERAISEAIQKIRSA